MTTHTQGPWTFRKKNGDTDSWWVTAGPLRPGHRGYVAFVAECVAREDASEANARLIAAAPDLLSALKAVQSQCAGHADEFSANVWRIAEAVIAKAEGR